MSTPTTTPTWTPPSNIHNVSALDAWAKWRPAQCSARIAAAYTSSWFTGTVELDHHAANPTIYHGAIFSNPEAKLKAQKMKLELDILPDCPPWKAFAALAWFLEGWESLKEVQVTVTSTNNLTVKEVREWLEERVEDGSLLHGRPEVEIAVEGFHYVDRDGEIVDEGYATDNDGN